MICISFHENWNLVGMNESFFDTERQKTKTHEEMEGKTCLLEARSSQNGIDPKFLVSNCLVKSSNQLR